MNFELYDLIDYGINENVSPKDMLMILAKANKCGWGEFETYRKLYTHIYGHTLCKRMCAEFTEHMRNESEAGWKWTIEQTNELARKNNISFGNDYTEYEFNTVVHMMYYDYSKDMKESGITNENIYAKMADSYLTDIDAPKGKLVDYFFFVMKK